MRISKMIEHLQAAHAEHGDIETAVIVSQDRGSSSADFFADEFLFVNEGRNSAQLSHPAFILILAGRFEVTDQREA